MYQIAVSYINDVHEAPGGIVGYVPDTNSLVTGIPSLFDAITAAMTYAASCDGFEPFTVSSYDNPETHPFGLWAQHTEQEASVYIEVQQVTPKTDVTEIVRLIAINTRLAVK